MEAKYNPYENMLSVVSNAAEILGYTPSDYEAVKYPERELKVAIPVRMDDGSVKVFPHRKLRPDRLPPVDILF